MLLFCNCALMSGSLLIIRTQYLVVLYQCLLNVRQLLQASAANAHITSLHSHSLDTQISSNYINVSPCPGAESVLFPPY